jgi:hypothetical protein
LHRLPNSQQDVKGIQGEGAGRKRLSTGLMGYGNSARSRQQDVRGIQGEGAGHKRLSTRLTSDSNNPSLHPPLSPPVVRSVALRWLRWSIVPTCILKFYHGVVISSLQAIRATIFGLFKNLGSPKPTAPWKCKQAQLCSACQAAPCLRGHTVHSEQGQIHKQAIKCNAE